MADMVAEKRGRDGLVTWLDRRRTEEKAGILAGEEAKHSGLELGRENRTGRRVRSEGGKVEMG